MLLIPALRERTAPTDAAERRPTAGSAARMISAAPPGRATFEVLTIAVTTAYSQPLPFAFTQRLTLHNWQFLTTRLRVFVVALGIGIALELTVANAEEDHVLAYR